MFLNKEFYLGEKHNYLEKYVLGDVGCLKQDIVIK